MGSDYSLVSVSPALLPGLLLLLTCCLGMAMGCARNPDRGARLHPPAQLRVVLRAGKIQLGWEATDSTTGAEYILYRSFTASGKKEKVLTTKATQCEVPFDSSRAEQYFCVTATLNGAAESDCSNVVKVAPPANAPPE